MGQLTHHILMVRPASFGINAETAETNFFQASNGLSGEAIQAAAVEEFEGLVHQLKTAGIRVTVLEDSPEPKKPDVVFPNNWISFHPDGRIFTFPMQPKSRRIERNPAIVASLLSYLGANGVEELHRWEEKGKFLEGTGSMVMDHENQLIYACLPVRPDPY